MSTNLNLSLSPINQMPWHEQSLLEIHEKYKKVDQYFYLDGKYEYENNWAEGAVLCQDAINTCQKIIKDVAEKLNQYSVNNESRIPFEKLDQHAQIFLNYFKNEKNCARISSLTIPAQCFASYASVSVPIYLLTKKYPSLSLCAAQVALISLPLLGILHLYNTNRLEKRKTHKLLMERIIKDHENGHLRPFNVSLNAPHGDKLETLNLSNIFNCEPTIACKQAIDKFKAQIRAYLPHEKR
ncbi:MAG: hypothetical protein H0X29_09225 [Parachlamydiaceae bacterium]|nr:hypothetical protein [Parachlamydiaceae bacterium]